MLHEADAGYCKILSTGPRPLILGECGPRPTLQSSVRPSASFHDRDAARRPKQLPMSGLEPPVKYIQYTVPVSVSENYQIRLVNSK